MFLSTLKMKNEKKRNMFAVELSNHQKWKWMKHFFFWTFSPWRELLGARPLPKIPAPHLEGKGCHRIKGKWHFQCTFHSSSLRCEKVPYPWSLWTRGSRRRTRRWYRRHCWWCPPPWWRRWTTTRRWSTTWCSTLPWSRSPTAGGEQVGVGQRAWPSSKFSHLKISECWF